MRYSVKAPLVCAALVLVAAGAVFGMASLLFENRLRAAAYQQIAATLNAELVDMRARLASVKQDVTALAEGPTMRNHLRADTPDGDLVARFVTLMRTHEDYFQIRLVDQAGRETVRVDRREDRIVVVPEGDLQDKAPRYYVREVLRREAGEVYVSPLDLNRENGRLERPVRPTLRVAAPLFDAEGHRRGGVIVNVEGGDILPPARVGNLRFLIANAQGEFLLHPDPAREFGLQIGSGVTFSSVFAHDLPVPGQPWALQTLSDVAEPVPFLTYGHWLRPDLSDADTRWLVMVAVPRSSVLAPIRSDLLSFAFIALLICLTASYGGWRLTQRPVKDLQRMTLVAKSILNGDYSVRSDVSGSDEIADLAQTLDHMTERIEDLIDRDREARLLLSQTNVALQRSNEDLESFARAAAHDLKTPLRALNVLPGWIEEDLELPTPEVSGHLNDMREQARRLDRLVDGLLNYSLIGRDEVEVSDVDLRLVVNDVVEMLVPDHFTCEVQLEVETASAIPAEVQLVLQNLVTNAITHHDGETGALLVATRSVPSGFEICVADDGPGIDPGMRQRVLEPLYTGKRQDDGAGTGLGLSFVRKIALLRGGSVDVLPNAPRGTVIRVVLDYGAVEFFGFEAA